MAAAIGFEGAWAVEQAAGRAELAGTVRVAAAIVFLPAFRVRIEGGAATEADSATTSYLGWLPRGSYRVRIFLPGACAAGDYRYTIEARHRAAMADAVAATHEGRFSLAGPAAEAGAAFAWAVEALPPGVAIENLSWKRGHADWFFRHFDHAATTIQSYMLGDSPLLRGRILDVGCGDGITDLGLALRTGCEELVGIDPFKGYERLPAVVRDNHLPDDIVPKSLRFLPADANRLPFTDDRFDAVISWGSVEHMAGGYLQALREIKRVLKPDGLLFIHPGLYYSNIGHHLGEFSAEPFFHLKKRREELERLVLGTRPAYMDRAGEFSTPAQYWQWFTELNPITVTRFEQELRALEFEPWRVAIRTEGLVEYTPELLSHPMQDLATNELYVSCISRKKG